MQIKFNRRRIESTCLMISFVFVILLTIFGILAIADSVLSWDILTKKLEKAANLVMLSAGVIILASFLISLMVNFSLLSISMETIAEKFENKKEAPKNEN